MIGGALCDAPPRRPSNVVAELTVRPLVRGKGDSLYVALSFHRSLTPADTPRTPSTNPTGTTHPAVFVSPRRQNISLAEVRTNVSRFVRSLERCDVNPHYDWDDSPWCWGPGRHLIEPELSRQQLLSRGLRARMRADARKGLSGTAISGPVVIPAGRLTDEWRARAISPTTPSDPQSGRRRSAPR